MKIILIVFFLILSLHSKDVSELKVEILSAISHSLMHKDKINIYVDDPTLSKNKNKNIKLSFVEYKNADIVFTSDVNIVKSLDNKAIVFATTYYAYAHLPHAVGAFFWQKGRPNIIFSEKRLKELSIKLPNKFDKYIE